MSREMLPPEWLADRIKICRSPLSVNLGTSYKYPGQALGPERLLWGTISFSTFEIHEVNFSDDQLAVLDMRGGVGVEVVVGWCW